MKRFATPAIVLRTVDYGDADRVVTLLSRDAGKLAALARGARRSVRRFGAGLGLFGVGEAQLTERPGAELCTLESFHGARGFPGLLTDMAKMAHGGYACELVRELTPARQPEPAVFDLLLSFLSILDGGFDGGLDGSRARPETLRIFELKLLELHGLRPEVDHCVSCDSEALDAPGQVFDARRGGVVCAACHGDGRLLGGEARRALAAALGSSLQEATAMVLAPALNADCREAVAALLDQHLGRPLKSREFIAKLNHA